MNYNTMTIESLSDNVFRQSEFKVNKADLIERITYLIEQAKTKQLILSGVVKCNCDESEQLEEEFEIHHLINDTYQVVGKDSNTVWKQGTLEDCNEFVML